jgi:hypothetical protein
VPKVTSNRPGFAIPGFYSKVIGRAIEKRSDVNYYLLSGDLNNGY